MAKFGHAVMMNRMNDKSNKALNPPKGFDITLADAVSELELSVDQIKELGRLTTTRRSGLAHATVGRTVYYRRRQLIEMLNVPMEPAFVTGGIITYQPTKSGVVVGD